MKIQYTRIERWMLDLGIKGVTMIIFSVIYGIVRSKNAPVDISYRELSAFTGYSRASVAEALKTLQKKGLIEKLGDMGQAGSYDIIFAHLPSDARLGGQTDSCPESGLPPFKKPMGTDSESGLPPSKKSMGTSPEFRLPHIRRI